MRIAVVTVVAIATTSCGFGVTGPSVQLADTSAQLTGDVHSTVVGTTEYWFEYGETTGYGATTIHRTVDVVDAAAAVPVNELVTGLRPGTLHHDRLCAVAPTGKGICGADRTFVTTGDRDWCAARAPWSRSPRSSPRAHRSARARIPTAPMPPAPSRCSPARSTSASPTSGR